MGLLNTDIRGISKSPVSLRKSGRVQVTDRDFRIVLPAVKKVANQEVDVIAFVKWGPPI